MKDYNLIQFLTIIGNANGDEVIELVSKFQMGAITIADIHVTELLDRHEL